MTPDTDVLLHISPDPHADWLATDEWFRLESAPVTYIYQCYANFLCGVECTVFIDVTETTTFPFRLVGYPEGNEDIR